MAFLSLSDLIVRVESRLSEVPGMAVQTYSEDTYAVLLQEAFDFLASQAWWPHLMNWYPCTLDGSTGQINEFLNGATWTKTFNNKVFRYEDIRAVFTDMSNKPLPELPRDFNPYLSTGNNMATYIEASNTAGKLFRVWPMTATNMLYVHARTTRDQAVDFQSTDIVPFDTVALVNYAAWKSSVDDATNQGQSNLFEQTMSNRIKQLLDAYNSKPVMLDPSINPTFYGWQEYPNG